MNIQIGLWLIYGRSLHKIYLSLKKDNVMYLERITISPNICHGKPCVRGMRWPVEVVLDMLGSAMTIQEILEDHPELEKEDILACLSYARLVVSGKPLIAEA